jgi:4-oxalocrotonate tautomerase
MREELKEGPDASCHHKDVSRKIRRSEDQKTQLADAIVKDVMAFAKVGDDAVSVAIEEVTPGDWTEKVYKPDILNSPGKLYKKPGQSPSIATTAQEPRR